MPAGQTMQLDVVLPLSDPAGLKAFLQQVYNPRQRELQAVSYTGAVHCAVWADAGQTTTPQ
jgi:hypothetical protein